MATSSRPSPLSQTLSKPGPLPETTGKPVSDIRLAAMELGWNNPKGDDIVPFLKEVKTAGYEGVRGSSSPASM